MRIPKKIDKSINMKMQESKAMLMIEERLRNEFEFDRDVMQSDALS